MRITTDNIPAEVLEKGETTHETKKKSKDGNRLPDDGKLFKGKYRLLRIIQTIVNFSVLISPKKLENFRLTRSKRKEPTPLELVDVKKYRSGTVFIRYKTK